MTTRRSTAMTATAILPMSRIRPDWAIRPSLFWPGERVSWTFDNDGLLDIFIANGHVYPEVDKQDWGTTWAERPQLFRNLDGIKFQGSTARNRKRPGGCDYGPRRGFRRPVQ